MMAMWGAPTLEMSDIPGYAHAHAALLGLIARSLGIPAWASRGEAPPMTLQDVLLAELAVEPEDWGMYGVAADHLEDKGDVAGAECLRWLAANHKRARRCVGPVSEGPYQWYAADVNDNPNDPASDLPVALLSEAPQKRILASRPSKFRLDFDSSLDALHCVLMCWRKATAAGWAPPHHTRDGGGTMSHGYSLEYLCHFKCGDCRKWWTIGDWCGTGLLSCPWCGHRDDAVELHLFKPTTGVPDTPEDSANT